MSKKTEPHMVYDSMGGCIELGTGIDGVIEQLNDIKNRILTQYPGATNIEVDEYDGDTVCVSVSFMRPETDKEKKEREVREERIKKNNDKVKQKLKTQRKKLYLRLKKEFGDG